VNKQQTKAVKIEIEGELKCPGTVVVLRRSPGDVRESYMPRPTEKTIAGSNKSPNRLSGLVLPWSMLRETTKKQGSMNRMAEMSLPTKTVGMYGIDLSHTAQK
jgi:hypothetical protein